MQIWPRGSQYDMKKTKINGKRSLTQIYVVLGEAISQTYKYGKYASQVSQKKSLDIPNQ